MTKYSWTAEGYYTKGGTAGYPVWSNPLNWQPQGVPKSGDDVLIPDADFHGGTQFCGLDVSGGLTLTSLSIGRCGLVLWGGTDPTTSIAVSGAFLWHATRINVNIHMLGTGRIWDATANQDHPGLINGTVLIVDGTLELPNTNQPFEMTSGSKVINNGAVHLADAQIGRLGGDAGVIINNGRLAITGNSIIGDGIELTNVPTGSIHVDANSTLSIAGYGSILHLVGGKVDGPGILAVSDGRTVGTLKVEADSVIPRLTLLPGAFIDPGPPPLKASMLTVSDKLVWQGSRPDAASNGPRIRAHVIIGPMAQTTVSQSVGLEDGLLENVGQITLMPGCTINCSGSQPSIRNTGVMTLVDTGGTNQGSIDNSGLIEKTGNGTATLGSLLNNTGNVAIRGGILLNSGYDWTISQGMVVLMGGDLGGLNTVVLAGGTGGGILSGSGLVGARVRNGGWVEPVSPGLTFGGGYQQDDAGNVLIPGSAWTAPKGPLLTIDGPYQAHLGGSIWGLST